MTKMTDAEVELVILHPAALICVGLLGTMIDGQRCPEERLTPPQLKRIGRRMWSWRTAARAPIDNINEARAVVRQAEEFGDPKGTIADAEVDFVLSSATLAALCAAPGWQHTALSLSKRQVKRILARLDEIADMHFRSARAPEELARTRDR